MSIYDDAARKAQQDAANGRSGYDAEAAKRMSSQQREAYEAAWAKQNK